VTEAKLVLIKIDGHIFAKPKGDRGGVLDSFQ
jgi:hypothetical protein